MATVLIALIALIAIAAFFFMLKSRGVGKMEESRAEAAKDGGQRFRPFEGVCSGVSYVADMYSASTVTVEIGSPGGVKRPLEVNARVKRPDLYGDERRAEIEALLSLGADYIDIGFNTDRVAAEFPLGRVSVSRETAEKAVRHLIRLRERSA